MVLVDEYDRKARLIPGTLLGFPVAVAVVALGLKSQPVIAFAVGLLSGIGGIYVIVNAVRTRGVPTQESLFQERGGAPTTHALRHTDSEWPDARRNQWRSDLAKATGISLPTAAQENADPTGADGTIETAIARLRKLTSDKRKFGLVFQENRNFGYERNILALRPIALPVCLVCLLILVGMLAIQLIYKFPHLSALSIGVGIFIVVVFCLFWWFVPSKDRTWLVGRRYAERLLDEAADL